MTLMGIGNIIINTSVQIANITYVPVTELSCSEDELTSSNCGLAMGTVCCCCVGIDVTVGSCSQQGNTESILVVKVYI